MATDMTVKFRCPHCQAQLEAGVKLMGKTGSCPKCGQEITVPQKDSQTESGKEEAAKEK